MMVRQTATLEIAHAVSQSSGSLLKWAWLHRWENYSGLVAAIFSYTLSLETTLAPLVSIIPAVGRRTATDARLRSISS